MLTSPAPGLRADTLAVLCAPPTHSCCTRCGAVLDDAIFSSDATFIKGPGGQSQVCAPACVPAVPLHIWPPHTHHPALQADGTFVPESGVARALGPRGARGFTFPADSHEKTLHKGVCRPSQNPVPSLGAFRASDQGRPLTTLPAALQASTR